MPPSREAGYRPRVGHELTFGLRPEHIIEGRGDVPPGAAAFEARLDVVEPMGMETMVYFIVDGVERILRLDAEGFALSPSASIDYAVMEHTEHAAVVPSDFGWSDVGSWSALWEISGKTDGGTVEVGDVIAIEFDRATDRA